MSAPLPYPEDPTERNNWIVTHRPQRNLLDPTRPYAFLVEDERTASGEIVPVATIFLTNRECPWRCLMCDLWKNTLAETVPIGAIPTQIDYGLQQLPPARQIKLYNSGSFFDPRAIPLEDHPAIANKVANFERVIVECHPSLIGQSCFQFKNRLASKLEVAMGLETAHPKILASLNKRMTLDQFSTAANLLHQNNIDLRVFILVKPPFMREEESFEWAARSLDFAFDCGATAVTLIPTRSGNGAMETLETIGDFAPPRLATLEASAAYGINLNRGRVFADLWDIKPAAACRQCYKARVNRLHIMNLQQSIVAPIYCTICEGAR